jgi:hypothetical protein
MQLWVAATIVAALLQTWRTALQQKLRGQLSVNAAAVVRYLYGVPVGLLLTGLYLLSFGGTLSAPTPVFFHYAALGGLGQIIGTNLLIMSFAHRGFAVGTAYAKRWPGVLKRSQAWRARAAACMFISRARCARP